MTPASKADGNSLFGHCSLMLGQAVLGEARVRRLRSSVPRRRCWKVADAPLQVDETNEADGNIAVTYCTLE